MEARFSRVDLLTGAVKELQPVLGGVRVEALAGAEGLHEATEGEGALFGLRRVEPVLVFGAEVGRENGCQQDRGEQG
jgi:hypothetical protein